ncbi:Glyceraldehyde-3-phosphate dehydrogenase [Geodia barretti]|uniref:Glyceraldehyde-3-phosphate dehydrogenase n=1 Tax=Geodia barretti TaxID=519541 RepID=A0AA35XJW6_GEOBA|nr:Glyceraldehyde-3-phosphate dehydrogenase [Geodia barretti]
MGADEIAGTREGLGWPHAPFTVPDSILAAWRTIGERGRDARAAWEARRAALGEGRRGRLRRRRGGRSASRTLGGARGMKRSFADEGPTIATRVANQRVIGAIADALPCLIGGSADLTGSNGTKTDALVPIAPGDYGGRYLYFGVREHAMGAVMNGMALHGGVIPFGGTFLTFTDYCRPAIRLSALMELRVIYVMTHDSIGLGEDGPTHQPIEHLASLRAMPNLLLFRPADAVETAECWELALANAERPSVLALTRQGVPCLRAGAGGNGTGNACARGGYVLREASGETPRVVLLATGSECAIADEARQTLEAAGVPTRLVSLPCWALFDEQEPAYRDGVLAGPIRCGSRIGGSMTVRIAINGFGRIGRNILRAIHESGRTDLTVVALNDLGDVETNAHLLRYDSVHGRFPGTIEVAEGSIDIGAGPIQVLSERDPARLPWADLGIDVALECTGIFTAREKAAAHLEAGARAVLISAPGTDSDLTVVYGVNHQALTREHRIVSNASCTTNCLAPVASVLHDAIGIASGFMTTVHAYTLDQPVLDTLHKDLRRARGAAGSMIPTSTGAARAVGLVLPALAGKLDGTAVRVPTANVSMVDLNFVAKRSTTVDEINEAVASAAAGAMAGVLAYSEEPLVSVDFNHRPESSIVDAGQTAVVDGTLGRVLSWYDNEWGFSNRMGDVAAHLGNL